jgi:hypothetical protein
VSDTEVTSGTGPTPAPACPVDHEALAAFRPTSTCAYAPGNAKRGYLVPGLIAFLCLLLIGAVLDVTDFSRSSGDRLGGPLVATQIATAYQGSAGGSLPSVTCPASEPVTSGLTFACRMTTGGAPKAVTVTETGGGRFHFQVGGVPGP